jgi:hypothetical protein
MSRTLARPVMDALEEQLLWVGLALLCLRLL